MVLIIELLAKRLREVNFPAPGGGEAPLGQAGAVL
jgi:hypothetical protein